ncbi:hypothetical protein BJ165DRAFT_1598961 [Panaeolus papilionaceus]|nr:hypothetical protein BJ165DRAFT_1598961 [Panaeolus papilionaceus]
MKGGDVDPPFKNQSCSKFKRGLYDSLVYRCNSWSTPCLEVSRDHCFNMKFVVIFDGRVTSTTRPLSATNCTTFSLSVFHLLTNKNTVIQTFAAWVTLGIKKDGRGSGWYPLDVVDSDSEAQDVQREKRVTRWLGYSGGRNKADALAMVVTHAK